MKHFIAFLMIAFSGLLLSCSPKMATVVYYDHPCTNSDSDVPGEQLNTFFTHYAHIQKKKMKSVWFNKEISKIADFVYYMPTSLKNDDLHYSRAFVINKRDTLFSDREYGFWRYGNKGVSYRSDSLYKLLNAAIRR